MFHNMVCALYIKTFHSSLSKQFAYINDITIVRAPTSIAMTSLNL